MNSKTRNFKFARVLPTLIYSIVALVLFVFNLYIYLFAPFDGAFNDTVLNAIITFSSLLVAVTVTAIYFHYDPGDHPRKIWLYMMFACWSWFLAELVWGAMAFVMVEVPAPDIPDVGWVAGNAFFTIAFYYQYTLIFPEKKKRVITIASMTWALAIFAPLFTLFAMQTFTAESYINYYYPIADLALGVAGISLIFMFQGGALMRPWVGLFVFGISDLFYAWAVQSGLYEWSAQNSDVFTTTIDSLYLAAYLVFGIGLISHWALITFGIRGDH